MPYRIDVAKMTPEPRRVEIPKHRQIGGSDRLKPKNRNDRKIRAGKTQNGTYFFPRAASP